MSFLVSRRGAIAQQAAVSAPTYEQTWTSLGPDEPGSGSWNMGFRFQPTQDFTLTQMGWRSGASASGILRLYGSDVSPLRSVAVTSSADSWVDEDITPIVLSSGVDYIVAVGFDTTTYNTHTSWTINPNCPITAVVGAYNTTSTDKPGNFPESRLYGMTRFTFEVP